MKIESFIKSHTRDINETPEIVELPFGRVIEVETAP
jgi:hypothetical protein